jgi:hypothetical protein
VVVVVVVIALSLSNQSFHRDEMHSMACSDTSQENCIIFHLYYMYAAFTQSEIGRIARLALYDVYTVLY